MDPLDELKGWDAGRVLALLKKLGHGVGDRLLRGEVEVEIHEALRLLVDATGRCIPANLEVKSQVCDENRLTVTQLRKFNYGFKFNYSEISEWYKEIFPKGTNFLEVAQFEDKAEAAKTRILQNPQIANLFKRAYMPVLFPQYFVEDLGIALQEFFLPVVKKGYELKFPDRKFKNRQDGELARQVTLLPNLGGEKLLAAMAAGPGMMWVFPYSLQGFSPFAQREAGAVLVGHGLGLSGAIANSLAIAGFPRQLAKRYRPGYDCSGDSGASLDYFLYFWASDDNLTLVRTHSLEVAESGCSGSLFFLG